MVYLDIILFLGTNSFIPLCTQSSFLVSNT